MLPSTIQDHLLSQHGAGVSMDLVKATLQNLRCHNLATEPHQIPVLEKVESVCGKFLWERRQGKAQQEHFVLGAVVVEK